MFEFLVVIIAIIMTTLGLIIIGFKTVKKEDNK